MRTRNFSLSILSLKVSRTDYILKMQLTCPADSQIGPLNATTIWPTFSEFIVWIYSRFKKIRSSLEYMENAYTSLCKNHAEFDSTISLRGWIFHYMIPRPVDNETDRQYKVFIELFFSIFFPGDQIESSNIKEVQKRLDNNDHFITPSALKELLTKKSVDPGKCNTAIFSSLAKFNHS